MSGTLEGQQSVESGKDSQKFPLFVQAGIDTTVAVPTALGDPTADTTLVPVYNFRGSPGASAADFASSTNPGIASNYGVDCQGIRVPSSARSTYQLSGKLNYSYGTGSRLGLHRSQQPVPGPHLPGKSRLRPAGS